MKKLSAQQWSSKLRHGKNKEGAKKASPSTIFTREPESTRPAPRMTQKGCYRNRSVSPERELGELGERLETDADEFYNRSRSRERAAGIRSRSPPERGTWTNPDFDVLDTNGVVSCFIRSPPTLPSVHTEERAPLHSFLFFLVLDSF